MKRIVALILLVLVSIAAAGLTAEFVVRRLRPGFIAGPAANSNPFWKPDAELGWFHIPGRTGAFSSPEFSHHVTINAMGFRDREREPAVHTTDGARPLRMAVLGDSTTWGHGVEVWNLAVSAYSTDQKLLLLRRVGRQVQPDVVLVMVDRNNFEGNVANSAYGAQAKPRFIEQEGQLVLDMPEVAPPSLAQRAMTTLRRRSAFVNGLSFELGLTLGRLDVLALEGRDGQIHMMLRLLEALRADVSGMNAKLAVGILPNRASIYPSQVPESESIRFDAIKQWGEQHDAPVFDLIPRFRREYAASQVWYHYREDKHLTARGHDIAARELAAQMQGSSLLVAPPETSGPGPDS